MAFEHLYATILQFLLDPFNRKALNAKLDLIMALEMENSRLRELLSITVTSPNTQEKKPEPLQPFRVRRSMRDKKAQQEARFNKVFRNIEAIERGDFDVHIDKDRPDICQSPIREGNG